MALTNRTTTTRRGFTYAYYFSPATAGKPTLLFAHGFPTPAYVWRRQIAFFEPLGFGVVAPDMLGYGGTDKPVDPVAYLGSGLAQDIADVLDKEGIEQVIAVGHDWGTRVVSRLYNYHPERVLGCAFLASGYGPPASVYADPIAQSEQIAAAVGYDIVAYMRYFVESDAHVLMEKNFDSFFSLLFPIQSDKEQIWRENMCVDGKAKAWIESNRTTELPPYISAEDKAYYTTALSSALAAPLCWYRGLTTPEHAADDARIPAERHTLDRPVLFVAFNGDPIAIPAFGRATHAQYVPVAKNTEKSVDGDHWALLSHADEVNKLVLEWLKTQGWAS
ncbi:Epoxide hydrolase [Mycena indigotica]|uniref:Epoxide hydrolase n=1 Tax=Mycena indigotica TaxID=2126181 RepID=A0A8H6RZL1_9AGAR|nr:Epoxide hydrolase [Mycena indigotica]KAF7290224.1 Epoxide hydrolase [Mycena indigotica]